ncbi:MAG: SEL1-like repeat protein [Clostridia bacterium]|nr:SEL1-like repeat protein [Clostridia bacterium]
MKCIGCGHEWTTDVTEGIVACPACGLEAAYVSDSHTHDKAVLAERQGNLEEAATWYIASAEEGTPCAPYAAYRCLSTIEGREKEADFWLWVSAELSDPLACYTLSKKLLKQKNKEAADYYLQKSAECGHDKACMEMARRVRRRSKGEARYYLSKLVDKNSWARFLLFWLGRDRMSVTPTMPSLAGLDEKRVKLGKYAQSQGYHNTAYACFCLAKNNPEGLYFATRYEAEGRGKTCRFSDIVDQLDRSGQGGCVEAYLYLAELLERQTEQPQRFGALSVQYYEKAAMAGSLVAQKKVGDLYYEGQIIPKNVEKALKWYQKAAALGDEQAAEYVQSISQVLTSAEEKVEQALSAGDLNGAVRLLIALADIGHTGSAVRVAGMFLRGEGCNQSPRLAATYYQKGVEGGSVEAVYQLGLLYAHNNGVKFSYKKAMKLLQIALEHGYTQARSDIETLKQRRRKRLLRRTHAIGCTLYHKGKKEEAIRYFLTASELGYAKSMYMLACFAEFGDGMKMDSEVAKKWFRKAAVAGFDGQRGRIKSGYIHQRKRNI